MTYSRDSVVDQVNDPTIWIDLPPNVQQTFDVTRREAVVRLVPANELDLKQGTLMR